MDVHSEKRLEGPVCLMIGNYDGVHLGHLAIVQRARALAQEHGFRCSVLSFNPHPLKVLDPERAPKLLQTQGQKEALLVYHGIDDYIVQPFDTDLARLSPEDFVKRLKQRIDFRFLLVGFNFRFGHQRAGDVHTLVTLGKKYGFETLVQPPFEKNGATVSSSRIRELVAQGEMKAAAELLGRPYFLEGTVGHGDHRGRTMKAPTANVLVTNELLPRFGVYASWTLLGGSWYRSITNIGVAPTVDREGVRFETHLLDFGKNLYDKHLFVCLNAFLRPEIKFASLEALRTRIGQDIRNRRELLDADPPTFQLDLPL